MNLIFASLKNLKKYEFIYFLLIYFFFCKLKKAIKTWIYFVFLQAQKSSRNLNLLFCKLTKPQKNMDLIFCKLKKAQKT